MTRVVIVDDHPIFRAGLRELIAREPDLAVVGEAGDAATAAALLADTAPCVAILDLSLPGGSGLDLVAACRASHPPVAALVLTMHAEASTLHAALDRGAAGYVLKENASNDVLRAIRAVASGARYLSPSIAGLLRPPLPGVVASAPAAPATPPLETLSPTGRMRIMIVDDCRAMRQLVREIVAPVGAEILECEDGDLAIEQFARFRPDWTVMDVRLPRVDGLTATRILRRTWPDCRIVMISELDIPSVAAAARQAGAAQFIPKSELMRLPAVLEP